MTLLLRSLTLLLLAAPVALSAQDAALAAVDSSIASRFENEEGNGFWGVANAAESAADSAALADVGCATGRDRSRFAERPPASGPSRGCARIRQCGPR